MGGGSKMSVYTQSNMHFLYRSGTVLATLESKMNDKWDLDGKICSQGRMIDIETDKYTEQTTIEAS